MTPALTLYRPWPALIFRAGKDIENRGWRTGYRGRLLIHAGRRWDHAALELASLIRVGDTDTVALDWISQNPDDHPTGIVGAVHLYDCHRATPSPWAAHDQWNWMIEDPREFPEPIPCAGKQQLWAPPAELRAALAAALQVVGLTA
jgi:hypothetical protein